MTCVAEAHFENVTELLRRSGRWIFVRIPYGKPGWSNALSNVLSRNSIDLSVDHVSGIKGLAMLNFRS
jgi:hypothetical protein